VDGLVYHQDVLGFFNYMLDSSEKTSFTAEMF
jgi:hypothetical protein